MLHPAQIQKKCPHRIPPPGLSWWWHPDLRGAASSSIPCATGLPGQSTLNRGSVTEGTYLWSHKHINTFTSSHAHRLWPGRQPTARQMRLHSGLTDSSPASTIHPGRKWVPDVSSSEPGVESSVGSWPGSPTLVKLPDTAEKRGRKGEENVRICFGRKMTMCFEFPGPVFVPVFWRSHFVCVCVGGVCVCVHKGGGEQRRQGRGRRDPISVTKRCHVY